MEINEKLAYCYWEYLAIKKVTERLKNKEIMDDAYIQVILNQTRDRLGLEESIEQLTDKNYLDKIIQAYGQDIESSPISSFKAMVKAKAAAGVDPRYRSFTGIVAKSRMEITSSYALQSWLRSRNTMAFLSEWEKHYNDEFLMEKAEAIIAESESKSSALTLKQWIPRTNAKGIVALQGRYGGTYAHPIIAMDFEAWLSPEKRFDLFLMLVEYEKEKQRH